ncbi:Delta-like protein 4 [Trichinella patagoniensis]|uniref:Delta-like protein 4 n=1 Tax=Trichinella patagoniensis TaxID=990121 RepID=A0A0V0ZLW9_9BILA|nr:Delta-like protein 4 [Trichinella patagoniensis]
MNASCLGKTPVSDSHNCGEPAPIRQEVLVHKNIASVCSCQTILSTGFLRNLFFNLVYKIIVLETFMIMSMNEVLLLIIWLLINGGSCGKCPVYSKKHNFGGKPLEKGLCLTLVEVSAVQRTLLNTDINHLHKFCQTSFIRGRLMSFTEPETLRLLHNANFKKDLTSRIVLHPGVYISNSNTVVSSKSVFIENCGRDENMNCSVIPYKYISSDSKIESGSLLKCKEERCCTGIPCDAEDESLLYQSPLLVNFSNLAAELHCRCLSLDQKLLEWNLPNELIYPCNNMQCDVFACVHEEHLDCVDVRVQTCTDLQGLVHCTEHCNKLFPKISYKEFEAKCKENGGFANMSEADKSCVCYNAQLYGDLCKTVHDPCSDEEICKNNGICESNGTHYTCDCLENFSGKDCTEIISQCSSNNDCKNFGTCVSHETGRSCNCLSGFFGAFCEFKAGYCKPATCQNDGICIQVTNVLLKCVCPEGYDGTFCELQLSIIDIFLQKMKNNKVFRITVFTILFIIIVPSCAFLFKYILRKFRVFRYKREIKKEFKKECELALILRKKAIANDTGETTLKVLDGHETNEKNTQRAKLHKTAQSRKHHCTKGRRKRTKRNRR